VIVGLFATVTARSIPSPACTVFGVPTCSDEALPLALAVPTKEMPPVGGGGGGAAATVTGWLLDAVAPSDDVTVTVTVYVAPAANV